MVEIVPYVINVLILIPVCLAMFFGNNQHNLIVFDKTVKDSPALRLLVGAVWLSILLCSVLGIMYPDKLVGILIMQWLYKTTFMFVYTIPFARINGIKNTAWGITISFLLIMCVWPYYIWLLW